MRIHVLGIGSIGTLISHHLRLANPSLPISLICKNARRFNKGRTRLHPYGQPGGEDVILHVERDGREHSTSGFEIEIWHDGGFEKDIIASDGPMALPAIAQHPDGVEGASRVQPLPNTDIDSLVVCLKAQATSQTLSILAPRLTPSSVVTLLQNGAGVYEELCKTVWPNPLKRPQFIIGTTTHGVSPSPTRLDAAVRHRSASGTGSIKFGLVHDPLQQVDFEDWLWGSNVGSLPILDPPPSPTLPLRETEPRLEPLRNTLTALLSLNRLNTQLLPLPHLEHERLVKVALNSIINPLTAILGAGALPNGSLISHPSGYRLMSQLARETSDAIEAHLLAQWAPNEPPPELVQTFSSQSLFTAATALARETRANYSSMATDVSRGRSTEIDYINGFIVALAKKHNISTPCHQMIIDMVGYTVDISSGGRLVGPSTIRKIDRLKNRRERLGIIHEAAPRRMTRARVQLEQDKIVLKQSKARLEITKLVEKIQARRRESRKNASMRLGLLRSKLNEAGRGHVLPTDMEWRKLTYRMKARVVRMAIDKVGGTAGWREAFETLPKADIAKMLDDIEAKIKSSKTRAAGRRNGDASGNKTEGVSTAQRQSPPSIGAASTQITSHQAEGAASTNQAVGDHFSIPDSSRLPVRPLHPKSTPASLNRGPSSPPSTPPVTSDSAPPPDSSDDMPTFKSGVSTSSIDSLIASAPRQERTWEVPVVPPTSRGPLPKPRARPKSSPSPASPLHADAVLPRGPASLIPGLPPARPTGRMANWMDSMITSAPRQERTWDVSQAPNPTGRKDLKKASISYRQGS